MQPIEQAFENGWQQLVPIVPGEKRPVVPKWQEFKMTAVRLRYALESGLKTFGLLAKDTPGVDIDIPVASVVDQIVDLAFDTLGPAPKRTGSKPKCLLCYRTDKPFKKKTLKIKREGMDKPWIVEILGNGQQYVLMGEHPSGKQYTWEGGSPVDNKWEDLTVITEEEAVDFLKQVKAKFPPGWTAEVESGTTLSEGTVEPTADALAAPSLHDVQVLVSGTPNPAFLGWDHMMNFGRAIKGATRGSAEGLAIFMKWCDTWEGGLSSTELQEKVWIGEPTVGWDWLMKLAADHGASTIAFDFDVVSDQVVESVVTNSPFTIDDVATADGVASWMARYDFFEVAYNPITSTWYRFSKGRWVIPPGNHRGPALAYPSINRALDLLHTWLSEQPMPPKSAPRLKMLTNLKSTPFADRVRTAMIKNGAWNIEVDTFDDTLATNHLLNTPEGTYDLDLYKPRAHDPLDYITKQTKVTPKFDDGKMPVWLDMLKRVTNNAEEIDFLQRYLGSALSGDTANKILLAIYGPSNSCKSTITDTIATNVLGVGHREYAAVAGENIILRRPHSNFDQHPTGLNTIRNSRFAVSHEGGDGMRWSENVIKRLTGGDALSTRELFSDGDTKRFYGRLMATANLLPQTDFVDSGMRERMIIMRLNAIPKGERKDLRNVIEAEAPYILGWLIEGHRKNRDKPVHKFIPASITEETEDALSEGDPVRTFVTEMITFNDDDDLFITTTADIYEAYCEFCLAKGFSTANNPIKSSLSMGHALRDIEEIQSYYRRTSTARGYRVRINTKSLQTVRDKAAIAALLDTD